MIQETIYTPLPVEVALHGIGIPGATAKLVRRTATKAMYSRFDSAWEVFRIQTVEAGTVFGKDYPAREVYPGNEDFGATAWCYHGERAEKRARGMYERI